MTGMRGQAPGHGVAITETEPLVGRILEFLRLLRAHGYLVGIREELDSLRVAERCRLMDRQLLRWGLRSLLCGNADEWRRFDRLFDAYWSPSNHEIRMRPSPGSGIERSDSRRWTADNRPAAEADQTSSGDAAGSDPGGARRGASRQESSLRGDFRFLSDEQQMRDMEALVERLAQRMRRRLLRRFRVLPRGRRIHLRRTIRSSLRYGGTPLDLVLLRRRRQLPRLILLLDVSRSMSFYSVLFLRFARGIVNLFQEASAFIYHTRLVPVTEGLKEPDSKKLRDRLAVLSLGWAGGTRIGDCLQQFNREHAARLVNSRSVVVIMSDGLDTGPPELLAAQLARIKERARTVIWLNPLLGREGYEPVARGMAAALPYLDLFAPAHDLDSLKALELQFAKAC